MMSYFEKDLKKLGFGLMRLPMIDEAVDIEQTKQMVDLFMEKGFTYFDTAYGYIDGKSEIAAKEALVDRYPRESFQLATKLPAWAGANTAKEAKNMFFTSLERTQAGYFDFYLLHNLGDNRTKYFDDYGIWEFLEEQKEKGLIRHLGFSFHDKADELDKILTKHPEMEFVQLQINYADWESKTVESRKCYEVARKHNKPIIIMEPVKGGSLSNLPDNIAKILMEENETASLSSWAIRFAASLDGIVTVLSGMSTLDQMKDNLSYMDAFVPLDANEKETVKKVQQALSQIPSIPCTDCQYCMKGCPQQIVIPKIFGAMNNYLTYNNLQGAKGNYKWETRNGGTASQCIECGQCEDACPQHIHIVDELKRATKILER
ncbi:MAG: aldo/keto reductase [Velocimicrobium sp.]